MNNMSLRRVAVVGVGMSKFLIYAIATGRYDVGLAVGVDSMTTCTPKGPLVSKDIEGEMGLSMQGMPP